MRLGAPLASHIRSIRHLLLPRGGIPPAARRRSRLALTLAEREDISRGIASGSSIREIARQHESSCFDGEPGGQHAMVAVLPIELMMQMAKHGSRPCDRSAAC